MPQYNSQKMYHIAYLIWGADITIFNYLSKERLLINPESSFPEIVNWPRPLRVSPVRCFRVLSTDNDPSELIITLIHSGSKSVAWGFEISRYWVREENLRCKAICITQPQIKPHIKWRCIILHFWEWWNVTWLFTKQDI